MDWFMLAAMVIAGWVVLSGFAGERFGRQPTAAGPTGGAPTATPAAKVR